MVIPLLANQDFMPMLLRGVNTGGSGAPPLNCPIFASPCTAFPLI